VIEVSKKKYDLVAESHCCRDKITNFDARNEFDSMTPIVIIQKNKTCIWRQTVSSFYHCKL